MIHASLTFFFFGLLSIAAAARGMDGVPMELSRLLLFVFLALSIVSFLASLVTSRGIRVSALAITSLVLGIYSATQALPVAQADETATEKVQNAAGDLKTGRKATGHDSVSNTAKKAKRKAD